jgi:predicted nucleic acid-binding Zn ribbon protein
MADAFRGKPLGKRLEEAQIWRIWDQTVGPQISTKARPSKFADGVLTVVVISAPWMQQLNFMKREISDKLNGRLGTPLVRDIYLKAGKPSRPQAPKIAEKPVKRPLTEMEEKTIEAKVAMLSDPELRHAFASLLATHFSTRKAGGKP